MNRIMDHHAIINAKHLLRGHLVVHCCFGDRYVHEIHPYIV